MVDITEYEAEQIAQANGSGRSPIVFIHGLWLLPMSWDRWRKAFEDAGYTTLAPGWPDDPRACCRTIPGWPDAMMDLDLRSLDHRQARAV